MEATTTTLFTILVALLASTVVWVSRARRSPTRREMLLARLPLLDASKSELLATTHNGYLTYLKNGQPYRLRFEPSGAHDRVMIPFKYLQEIKECSEKELSFYLASEIDVMLKYSKSPAQTPALTHTAKSSLNRNLAGLIPLIHDGLSANIADTLPETGNWTSVPMYPTFLTIMGRNTARIIGDPRLSGNDEWIHLSIHFTEQTFAAAHTIRNKFHWTLYWLCRWLDGPSREVRKCRKRAAEILKPIYEEYKENLSAKTLPKYDTGLYWLLSTPKRKETSLQEVTDDLLLLSLAAVHTTTLTLTTMIRDLVIRPEIFKSLQQEVMDHCPDEANWTAAQLSNLPLMDSFMKESQRINFIALNTILRAPYKDYTFRDGLIIPARTICEMAGHELNKDPDVYLDPEKFDATRFYDLKQSTSANNYGSKSVATKLSVNFGVGAHTCPGRQFASLTMKMALAELLMKYELKWEDGKEAPEIISDAFTRMVDPMAIIMVRKTS